MKKFSILLLSVLTLTACRSPERLFVSYQGQQPAWPTAPGAFTKTVEGIPIYRLGEFPAQAYDVLGYVIVRDEGTIAELAKAHHADAAILLRVERRSAGINATWSSNSFNLSHDPFPDIHAKALLIKYRPQER